MSNLLEVNNLFKEFGSLKAINDLSFQVQEGDVYGFLGQNGAGKSTSIRMLLTLIKPTSGQINIFGKPLQENRAEILRQVGAVIERPDLYKFLSAYDNISIFARLSGIKLSRKVLMEKLDRVGLADRSSSKVKTYSQGMNQRLGIAVALVHDPKLIILDEPTNGLDPQGIADMRRLIISLSKDQGKTVIVSSHLLSEIEQIANRMIIIHKGKKIIEGEVATLLNPEDSIVEINTLDNEATLQLLQNSHWSAKLMPSHPAIKLKMNKNHIPQLSSWLVQQGVAILAIKPMHSLEDYFLNLTNPAIYVEPVTN